MSDRSVPRDEIGAALLITLIVLSLFSALGLYMTLNATTGIQISDNHESRMQATYAALSGLSHARVLLSGVSFGDLLTGPDGSHSSSPTYMAQAKSYAFRNPVPLAAARLLNILDPSPDISGLPDDGIINTGFYEGVNGTALIPLAGIALGAAGAQDPGSIKSRYFVKVSDNNREATEVAGDPPDNPFFDGDGIVIVRSIGVAKSLSDAAGLVRRSNSVVVFEGRFKRLSAFDLGPALIVEGPAVDASFAGAYEISGGSFPAIGVIDTIKDDTVDPSQMIRDAAGPNVTGGGLPAPSVQEMNRFLSGSDKTQLLDPRYLWDFARKQAPQASDHVFAGNQYWNEGNAPYAGSYDPAKPANAPGQDPKIITVNGDLFVTGNFSGGGLLIVTGSFSYTGPFAYSGLIILAGSGRLIAAGSGAGVTGSVFMASLADTGGEIRFGTPVLSISENSRIIADRNAVRMALALIPPSQISFREIAGQDP